VQGGEQRRGLLRSAPVGSRWTAVSGPLAQKTPTLLNPLPRATRGSLVPSAADVGR